MVTALQIYDEDNVLRRVTTHLPNYIKPDGSIYRMAFRPKKGADGVSVDLERLSSYEKATHGSVDYRLLRINVGTIRHDINDDLEVVYDPTDDNEAHTLITGNFTKGKQNQLVKNSEEVVNPE